MSARRLLPLLALPVLALPAIADAAIKHGYYIDVKSGTYIQTNNAGTSIKSFTAPCFNGRKSSGQIAVTRKLKISSSGSFSYTGKTTLSANTNSVIDVKVTGKLSSGKLKGKVVVTTKGTCDIKSYSAKYYGTKVQG